MGVLHRIHRPKLNRRQCLSGARRVGLVSSCLFREVARSDRRVAAYCLAEAGHDPGKCVRPELIERGG